MPRRFLPAAPQYLPPPRRRPVVIDMAHEGEEKISDRRAPIDLYPRPIMAKSKNLPRH